MNIKKLLGNTVDAMTLSYTERHLKEAFEQENAVPTTILSIIAEKSHNEYNLKATLSFFDKAFKIDLKEWKKYRNLMKIIEYLLKFGSHEFVASVKKYTNEIRMLQNYNLTESGIDRGTIIRETASYILKLLSSSKELEEVRDQSKKQREKYTGFSSDSSSYTRSGNYNTGYNSSSHTANYNTDYASNYSSQYGHSKTLGFSDEKNQKFADSVFGGLPRDVERSSYSSAYQDNEYNKPPSANIEKTKAPDIFRSREPEYKVPDIFASVPSREQEYRTPDIFANTASREQEHTPPDIFSSSNYKDQDRKTNDLFTREQDHASNDIFTREQEYNPNHILSREQIHKAPDIFTAPLRRKQDYKAPDIFSTTSNKVQESKAPDIFSSTNKVQEYKTSNTLYNDIREQEYKSHDIFSNTIPKPRENKSPDIFSSNKEQQYKPDIFSSVKENPYSSPDIFPTTIKDPELDKPDTNALKLSSPDIFSSNPAKPPDIFKNLEYKNPSSDRLFNKNPKESYLGGLSTIPVKSTLEENKKYDIFSAASTETEPKNKNNFIDFPVSPPVKPDIFAGMVYKDSSKSELKKNQPESIQTNFKGTENPSNYNLEILGLSITPNVPNPYDINKPVNTPAKDLPKIKFNLKQDAPAPRPEIKKVLSPKELEAKLFGLDII
jgi:ENTH domain